MDAYEKIKDLTPGEFKKRTGIMPVEFEDFVVVLQPNQQHKRVEKLNQFDGVEVRW